MEMHTANIVRNIPVELYPTEIQKAVELRDAAEDLLNRVRNEPPVDISTVTAKNLEKVHADAVEHDVRHSPRLHHAEAIARHATAQVDTIWFQSTSRFMDYFRDQFNQAIADLHKELDLLSPVDPDRVEAEHWNPDFTSIRDALYRIEQLAKVRDDYAHKGGRPTTELVSNVYDQFSRTAIFDSNATVHALHQATRGRYNSTRYWITAAQFPGVELKWQTITEQLEQPAPKAIKASRDSMQQQIVSRAVLMG